MTAERELHRNAFIGMPTPSGFPCLSPSLLRIFYAELFMQDFEVIREKKNARFEAK